MFMRNYGTPNTISFFVHHNNIRLNSHCTLDSLSHNDIKTILQTSALADMWVNCTSEQRFVTNSGSFFSASSTEPPQSLLCALTTKGSIQHAPDHPFLRPTENGG